MTKVKICGITNIEDAQLAAEAGADMLGLIFVESSPRGVTPAVAKQIRTALTESKSTCQLVGVFKNESANAVKNIACELKLDMVQLHGDESPEFARDLRGLGMKLVKVIELSPDVTPVDLLSRVESYATVVDMILFDKPKKSAGVVPTDETDVAWLENATEALESVRGELPPFFFAGGLTDLNVESVLKRVRPDAVDAASSLELRAGKKDVEKMQNFVAATRRFESEGTKR